jgi:hypothetical protein
MGRRTEDGTWDKRFKKEQADIMPPSMVRWLVKIALLFLICSLLETYIFFDSHDLPIITLMIGFPIFVRTIQKLFRLPILILNHGGDKEAGNAQYKKEGRVFWICTIITYMIIYFWIYPAVEYMF